MVYSIVGGADAAKFAVNAATGALAFVAAPDFEAPTDSGANNDYDVTVQVSDGTRTDTQAIAVTVTPVNEAAPVITSNGGGATAAISVAENAAAVTTLTATDADLPTPTLVYSITGGADAAKFTINAANGALAFLVAPNFEAPTDSGANSVYDVTVQVSDGTRTDTQAMAVTVNGANDAPLLNPVVIAAGVLDANFSGDGMVKTDLSGSGNGSYGYDVAVQADGKIVMGGYTRGTSNDFALVRYLVDGSLDTSFSGDGKVSTDFGANSDDRGHSVAIQNDGKVVVAGNTYSGSTYDFAIVRYNNDGTLDTGFSGDGKQTVFGSAQDYAYGVSVQANGKILVAGASSNNFALARLNADGSLDTSFDSDGRVTTDFSGGIDQGWEVATQADGKIVVSGRAYNTATGIYDFSVARYNTNGSLDTSFDLDGKASVDFFGASGRDFGYGMALQADGKILVTGEVYNTGTSNYDFGVARFNANGSLDTSFDGDGKLTTGFAAGANEASCDVAARSPTANSSSLVMRVAATLSPSPATTTTAAWTPVSAATA